MVDQQLDDDEYFIHFKDDVLENEFTKEVSIRVTAEHGCSEELLAFV